MCKKTFSGGYNKSKMHLENVTAEEGKVKEEKGVGKSLAIINCFRTPFIFPHGFCFIFERNLVWIRYTLVQFVTQLISSTWLL